MLFYFMNDKWIIVILPEPIRSEGHCGAKYWANSQRYSNKLNYNIACQDFLCGLGSCVCVET